jgi:hypothetical protein
MLAGWSADWVGARPTALVILLAELAVLLWGWLGVSGYHDMLLFALLLGSAGASFAVSLPIAGRAYPPAAQGGRVGSGCISERGHCADPISRAALGCRDGWYRRFHIGPIPFSCPAGTAESGASSCRMVAQCGGTHPPPVGLLALSLIMP